MNITEIMLALAKPFSASDVEWRLQVTNGEKTSGMAVPYIDNRAIQRRLDETVGAFNWRNVFSPWQNNAQLCGISIYCEERGEWITKYDGADNSDIEPVKGGLSDSMKRAAVQWGIGRYLYGMDAVWVDVEQKGKSVLIKKDQQKKLDDTYNKMVAQQAKSEAAPPPAGSAPTVKQPTKQEKPKAPEKPADDGTPKNPPIGANDAVLPFPELYTVTSAKKSDNGNGVSTALEMTDPQGKPVRAYLRGEDPAIKNGIRIKSLHLTEKKSAYGPYYIVDKYEIAA